MPSLLKYILLYKRHFNFVQQKDRQYNKLHNFQEIKHREIFSNFSDGDSSQGTFMLIIHGMARIGRPLDILYQAETKGLRLVLLIKHNLSRIMYFFYKLHNII